MQRHALTLHRLLLAIAAASCLVGCAKPESSGSDAPQQEGSDPQTVARRLVAEMMSLPLDQVEAISVEQQDFSDASLGCPSPGMSYAQVITAGYKVLVEADGRRFDVRVTGEYGKICHRRKPGAPREPSVTPESFSEAVAAAEPCATGGRSLAARFSA